MALKIADKGYDLQNGKIVLCGLGKKLLTNPEVKKALSRHIIKKFGG